MAFPVSHTQTKVDLKVANARLAADKTAAGEAHKKADNTQSTAKDADKKADNAQAAADKADKQVKHDQTDVDNAREKLAHDKPAAELIACAAFRPGAAAVALVGDMFAYAFCDSKNSDAKWWLSTSGGIASVAPGHHYAAFIGSLSTGYKVGIGVVGVAAIAELWFRYNNNGDSWVVHWLLSDTEDIEQTAFEQKAEANTKEGE
jgi:hypothetical protein